jgi:hypothetical protein
MVDLLFAASLNRATGCASEGSWVSREMPDKPLRISSYEQHDAAPVRSMARLSCRLGPLGVRQGKR